MDPTVASRPPICAVVVTYLPTASVLENVAGLREQFPLVVIVDNGSGVDAAEILTKLESAPDHRVIRNSQNLGIAAALNQGLRLALAKRFAWAATFDQDSSITPGFARGMLSAYEQCSFRERVALVAPAILYPGTAEKTERTETAPPSSFIRTAMTSGSLIKTSVLSTTGFYDESLFMDYVDYDYCLRLQQAGYALIRANRVFLQHRLGTAEVHSVLGQTVTLKSHNVWRRYYITRNRVLMYRRYLRSFPLWCLHDLAWFFIELGKIFLFEQAKLAKLRNVAKGLVHGLTGKTGQLENPRH